MRYVRSALLAAVLVPVLTAAVAACGASSTGSSPAPRHSTSAVGPASPAVSPTTVAAPTSCDVVTSAEASAALGQQVKKPILGKAVVEGGVACVFYGPDVPAGTSPDIAVGDSVRVVLVTGADAKKWFDNYRSKVHARTIAGLGDAAYYDGYASLSVLKGDAYVRIAVGVANNLQPEITLARDALPRM
ncbi:MAG TPA: hypothetical protein VMA95_13005 [Streptosporangiaceae bacterium]|nr:hypothetical protein [Streptosporangiaceae bacterium]